MIFSLFIRLYIVNRICHTKALDLLDDYDHRAFKKVTGHTSKEIITYEEYVDIITKLRFNEESELFAIERDNGLKSILVDIYQTFGENDIYLLLKKIISYI